MTKDELTNMTKESEVAKNASKSENSSISANVTSEEKQPEFKTPSFMLKPDPEPSKDFKRASIGGALDEDSSSEKETVLKD